MNASSKQKSALSMLIVALMVLSTVLAVVISAAPTAAAAPAGAAPIAAQAPPPPASGTITFTPTAFETTGTATQIGTIAVINGGTFTSSSKVFVCLGTSTSSATFTRTIGATSLPAGATTASNLVVDLSVPGGTGTSVTGGTAVAAGSYYVAATDSTSGCDGSAALTSPVAVTLSSSPVPSFSFTNTTYIIGSSVSVAGSGWDAGATVTVYLNYPTSPTVLATFTTTSTGSLPATAAFTVPTGLTNLIYAAVAMETSGPATGAFVGFEAAYTSTTNFFTVGPSITVSPFVFNGATSSSLTISGNGFTASSTITANTGISITAPAATALTFGAVSVSSTGTFTVTATTDTAIAAPGGEVYMTVTTSPATSVTTFQGVAWVSSPNTGELKVLFTPTSSTCSLDVCPTNSIAAEAWNFPAGATITFSLGPATVGTAVADSLGFAQLPSTAVLPGMTNSSAGFAFVAADISAGFSTSDAGPFTVGVIYSVVDSTMSEITGEYLASGQPITVSYYGLGPGVGYTFCDSLFAAALGACPLDSVGAVYLNGLADLSVSVGTLTATGSIQPAANGTIIFTYTPMYDLLSSVPTTGTAGDIGFWTGATATTLDSYHAIGTPSISTTAYAALLVGGSSGSITIGNLIPSTATVGPGASFYYNLYLGTSILTVTPGAASSCLVAEPTACSTTTGTLAFSFTVPTLSNGIYDLAIVYNGGAVPSLDLASVPVIVSVGTTSPSSGTLAIVTDPSGNLWAVGYGLDAAATDWYLNVSTYGGMTQHTIAPGSTGAFAQEIQSLTSEPAGTYAVTLYVTTSISGNHQFAPVTYMVPVALAISTPSSSSGPIGTTIVARASGLLPGGFYDVYFAGSYVDTVGPASSAGAISGIKAIVPTIADGAYNLAIAPTGTTTFIATAPFTVTSTTEFTLTSGGADASTAFPTELVSFAWTPATHPTNGVPVSVTVLLNGTAFTTEPAALAGGVLSGSFVMPNAPAGTNFGLSLEWTQTVVTSGASATTTYTSATSAFLQLVSGNGALLTGISPGQIAEITDSINSTLAVPLSELHASVESINNATAKILTAFGTMTATLSSINATLTSVAGTVATIETSIGTITTSLSTISAQITSVNGVVTSMNGTLNVVAGNVVSIQTSLGTINGKVTSVINGIATVQTSLGNLSVAVSKIPTSPASASAVNTAVYLLYAAIALIVITLALAAVLLVRSGGRGGQGGHPAKAYEGPSSSSSTPPSSGGSGGGSTGGA